MCGLGLSRFLPPADVKIKHVDEASPEAFRIRFLSRAVLSAISRGAPPCRSGRPVLERQSFAERDGRAGIAVRRYIGVAAKLMHQRAAQLVLFVCRAHCAPEVWYSCDEASSTSRSRSDNN
ncbi:hypothetical protein L209DRAFT_375004 [Thermothelomyces heterothallicus CBS 203.75]